MSFRDRVYAVVTAIPPGFVLGYGDVAAACGSPRAARQVGWALAALPADTEVPWQRVLLTTGHLAFRGDPVRGDRQRRRLEEEGVVFDGDRVPMERHRWDARELQLE